MEGTKVVVVGAGPVGSLAALYAAARGASVEIYELRPGKSDILPWHPLEVLALSVTRLRVATAGPLGHCLTRISLSLCKWQA